MNLRPSPKSRAASAGAALALVWLLANLAAAQTTNFLNRKDAVPGITTAGQPTAQQLEAAAAEGYKTVIDLRGPAEDRGLDEKAAVEKLGMNYVNLPVMHAAGVTYANAAALDELLAKLKGPVLLHCATGNRAGALLALRAKLHGADKDQALALGVAAGVTGLKKTVEDKLAAGHD